MVNEDKKVKKAAKEIVEYQYSSKLKYPVNLIRFGFFAMLCIVKVKDDKTKRPPKGVRITRSNASSISSPRSGGIGSIGSVGYNAPQKQIRLNKDLRDSG